MDDTTGGRTAPDVRATLVEHVVTGFHPTIEKGRCIGRRKPWFPGGRNQDQRAEANVQQGRVDGVALGEVKQPDPTASPDQITPPVDNRHRVGEHTNDERCEDGISGCNWGTRRISPKNVHGRVITTAGDSLFGCLYGARGEIDPHHGARVPDGVDEHRQVTARTTPHIDDRLPG